MREGLKKREGKEKEEGENRRRKEKIINSLNQNHVTI